MARKKIETLMAYSTVEDFELQPSQEMELKDILSKLRKAHIEEKLAKFKIEKLKAQYIEILGNTTSRTDDVAFIATYNNGKRTTKKELLIENGVTIEQIEASTVVSDGYYSYSITPIGPVPELEELADLED